MTALHTYSYIVVDTQRGCHTLKLKTADYIVPSIYNTLPISVSLSFLRPDPKQTGDTNEAK